eukprot:scaffold259919_cov31-Tisochrysis_lutea.AAC.9
MAMRGALQVVVVRVLGQSPIHEGPGEVVNCILLRLNRLGHHLGAHVVVQEVIEVGLHWKWLVEELAV